MFQKSWAAISAHLRMPQPICVLPKVSFRPSESLDPAHFATILHKVLPIAMAVDYKLFKYTAINLPHKKNGLMFFGTLLLKITFTSFVRHFMKLKPSATIRLTNKILQNLNSQANWASARPIRKRRYILLNVLLAIELYIFRGMQKDRNTLQMFRKQIFTVFSVTWCKNHQS